MRTAKAFQEIASSCFRQFRLNQDVLLRKRNPEALHQARVAIRRHQIFYRRPPPQRRRLTSYTIGLDGTRL
ncbi:CHAD domain-containing protein [Rhizobium aethiopicum]|uniref:CHAD domain-containing protein n=1 Tax=Rhizobium aethiopicum TaxID=1138170 RepID=UPI000B896145